MAILRLLHDRGYSINKLARVHGLSPTRMHNILRGRSTPRPEELAAVAMALDCPVTELLDHDAIARVYA